jgi:hypothetical protein
MGLSWGYLRDISGITSDFETARLLSDNLPKAVK